MYLPKEHGAKDIWHFNPYLPQKDAQKIFSLPISQKIDVHRIFLYDQEPVECSATCSLQQIYYDSLDTESQYIVSEADFAQLIAAHFINTKFPIWCSSDFQGKAIEDLLQCGFIPCHYWYHAFVARDWYRHYQHWNALEFQNRAPSSQRFLMYCRDTTGSREYRQQIVEQLHDIRRNIRYDWEANVKSASDLSATIDVVDAQSSEIHLVLETLFDTDKLYLTEKVFKPMVMNQAFVIWGPPGTLAFLRSRGFQTFGSIWSEEYDSQLDPVLRMNTLVNLVQSLNRLSDQEWKRTREKCWPIINHNREWFYSEKFMSQCWAELKQNFQQALDTRSHWEQTRPGGQFFQVLNQNPDLYKIPSRGSAARKYLASLNPAEADRIRRYYPKLNV